MPKQVTITTGARLHFGPFACKAEAGRQFGGVGVMIDNPISRVHFSVAYDDGYRGPQQAIQRCRRFLGQYRQHYPAPHDQPLGIQVMVDEAIPDHAGFGSGTQLAMSVAEGANLLAGYGPVPADELATQVGRGRRSAVGVYGFQRGGLVVDGGKTSAEKLGALIGRYDVPSDWRWVLVTPNRAAGLAGENESAAFERLGAMPRETTDRLSRIALLEMVPAMLDGDFNGFSEAVYQFGCDVGDYFSPIQGGRYAHAEMALIVKFLREQGIAGVGQSSWGPTIFALCPDQTAANQVASDLENLDVAAESTVRIAAPMNTGAVIETGEF